MNSNSTTVCDAPADSLSEQAIRLDERRKLADYFAQIAPSQPTELRQFCQRLSQDIKNDRISF